MMFRSYAQLSQDIIQWLPTLPDISGVSGVPRSGIIPAAMLAQCLHVPYIPMEALLERGGWFRPEKSRRLEARTGPVLVLDDTVNTGGQISEVKEKLGTEGLLYGAVYCADRGREFVDVAGYDLPWPHTFEWNLLRDWVTARTLTDMDGVLCEDWGKPDFGNVWLSRYETWLHTAMPLHPVGTVKVKGVVTSRLSKYRPQTIEWLERNGVEFESLTMSPYATAEERNARKTLAKRKADAYNQHKKGRQSALLFIESDTQQAEEIAQRTKRAVLDYGKMQGLNMVEPSRLFYRSLRCSGF